MASEDNESGIVDRLKDKLNRMLGRKESEPFDISFKGKTDSPSARAAFRIHVNNMQIVCRDPRVKCRINDISANGIGFTSSKEFPVGEIIESVLLWSGKPILKDLKLKVVRRKEKLVGCEFHELDKNQDKVVSKIVVAAQKRAIKCTKLGKKTDDETENEIIKVAKNQAKRGSKKTPTKKIEL
ncbi:PilZ domain-containing protein [Maridesulfovibrio ferrireducens]|uniref:PilZ domain-containing protein n=1 Tax=Maridesulfovibrio ferrireducens TaxID=246191 RepID=A0A1G9ELG0_9BACT|nr:PilZ domain-containing protein [Maridesulfovibrio ferrireducens]SDK76845.1 PilZ domain-containing protein [Maridesulfovibrio ferrireducens]